MLTLRDVADGFGVGVTLQQLRNRLRKLERESGRRILIVRGEGRGRRYLVNAQEMSAAMEYRPNDPPERDPDVDEIAARIAEVQNEQSARIQALSERLYAVERQVGLR